MPNWVSSIVAATAEAESPARFQYWSALSALSAVIKKNIHMDRYYYKLYPNIYVFLVAKSGLRKGNPVSFAKKLVQEASATRVVMGRNSIQAVLKELGRAMSLENGGVLKEASAFLVSGELASFFVKDPEALTILTDLYDTHACEPEWKNTLKTSGIDVLKNPCITLLGATNEDHFKEAVPINAIGGGFIARTLIVFESQRRVINDLLDPPKIIPDTKELVKYLVELSQIKGVFKLDKDTKETYRAWYNKISTEPHEDKTGTIERMGDTVLKVAMLISLAKSFDLVIKRDSMYEAIDKCMECTAGLKQVTMGGAGDLSEKTAMVLKELLKRDGHQMKRSAILSKFWGEMDSIELDRIIETLTQGGVIDAARVGQNIIYTMKKAHVDAYLKFKIQVN